MKRVAVHPILLAAYPVLSLFVFNTDELPIQQVLVPLVLVLLGALLIRFIIGRLVPGRAKADVLTSVFLILFFSFGHAVNAFRLLFYSMGRLNTAGLFFESTFGQLLWCSVWIFIFGVAGLLIRKTHMTLWAVSQFLNVFSLALLLILAVTWTIGHNSESAVFAYSESWNKTVHSESSKGQAPAKSFRPSIYYIILDGYGREDILKSIYAIDNSQFYSFLTEKGFYVARQSTANYMQTPLSLASSLNSVYLDDLVNKIGNRATSRLPLITMISNSELVAELQANGYKFVAFSSGSPLTEIKAADVYKSPELELSAFDNVFLDTTPLPLLLRLPFLVNQYDLHRERILYTFGQLPAVEQPDVPVFVFAHIMAPHPPFVFDANGAPIDPDMRFDFLDGSQFTALAGEQVYVQAYRQQLIFVTAKTQQLVQDLLSRPNPPIIILQGDHGPGSMLDWMSVENTNIPERMSILNAYYFPDGDYRGLYPTITPVNSFKVILNHYFDGNLPMSQDRNYFSSLDRPYLFTDVTDRLRAK